jgi:hypothetical protein
MHPLAPVIIIIIISVSEFIHQTKKQLSNKTPQPQITSRPLPSPFLSRRPSQSVGATSSFRKRRISTGVRLVISVGLYGLVVVGLVWMGRSIGWSNGVDWIDLIDCFVWLVD